VPSVIQILYPSISPLLIPTKIPSVSPSQNDIEQDINDMDSPCNFQTELGAKCNTTSISKHLSFVYSNNGSVAFSESSSKQIPSMMQAKILVHSH